MRTHQDAKSSTDQPIIGSKLKIGQWIQFRPSQLGKGSHPSEKINGQIFLVYGCDTDECHGMFSNHLTYKLIDGSTKRSYYYPLLNKFDQIDVRDCDIYLVPSERAKKNVGAEGLQAISRFFDIQLPQDFHERNRKRLLIQTINRFDFQEEVAEFIKLEEGQEKASLGMSLK